MPFRGGEVLNDNKFSLMFMRANFVLPGSNFSRLFFLLVFSAICLTACKQDDDGDGVENSKDKCKNTAHGVKVDKNGCEVKQRELGAIHFYMDNSASMGGYFNKDADFKTKISDITTKVEKNIKPLDIWFIAGTATKYNGNSQKFSTDIATTPIATQDGYQLFEMIRTIADRNDSNDVSLLVSDCILSFPDSLIKKNREINKTEAPNSLKNSVFSTFSDLNKKGLATSVYAFRSKFYGKYFNYQNTPTDFTKDGISRPYYIWVIANKDLLKKFNSRLADISTFMPEKQLHFGLDEEPVTAYNIIPQIERKGEWNKNNHPQGLKDIEMGKSETVQFCLTTNLDSLPEYARNIKYLKENLKIETTGCETGFTVKTKAELDRSKLKSDPQIALVEGATHGIIFKLISMNLTEAKIHVTLPRNFDTWYEEWSCMDDKDCSATQNQTFALNYLITGVKEAYESKNKNYIDFTITLNK